MKKSHVVAVKADDYPQEIIEWCNVTLGLRRTTWNMVYRPYTDEREFTFDNEQDAMIFALKWK